MQMWLVFFCNVGSDLVAHRDGIQAMLGADQSDAMSNDCKSTTTIAFILFYGILCFR